MAAAGEGDGCNPQLYYHSSVGAQTSYCTDLRQGFDQGTVGLNGGCLKAGDVSTGCPCSCYCRQALGVCWGSYYCASSVDGSKEFCYTTTTACPSCPGGERLVGCGCSADWASCVNGTCEACPSGHFSSGAPGVDCQPCTPACAQGYYPLRGCTAAADLACTECPAGSYCPGGQGPSGQGPSGQGPLLCPAGAYCPRGSDRSYSCTPALGQLCPTAGLATFVPGCVAGYAYSPGLCTACAKGKYLPYASSLDTACVPCVAGLYQGGLAGTSCQVCPAGSYTADGILCQSCAPGSACPLGGCTACQPCRAGYFAQGLQCAACAAGQYSEGAGATACAPCPVGQYSSGAGQTACARCGNGTTTFAVNSLQVATGVQASASASACQACPKGLRVCPSVSAVQACCPCPEGMFCAGEGGPPVPCPSPPAPPGTYQVSACNASAWQVNAPCLPCGAGEYLKVACQAGGVVTQPSRCLPCTACNPAGGVSFVRYALASCNATSDAVCLACNSSAGDMLPGGACNPCPAGTSHSANSSCAQCGPGTFAVAGKPCVQCPAGKTSGAGAGACSASCGAGRFAPNGSDSSCQPLASGSTRALAWDPRRASIQGGVQLQAGGFLAAWSPAGLQAQLLLLAAGAAGAAGAGAAGASAAGAADASGSTWVLAGPPLPGTITRLRAGLAGLVLLTAPQGVWLVEPQTAQLSFAAEEHPVGQWLTDAVQADQDTVLATDSGANAVWRVTLSTGQSTAFATGLTAPSAIAIAGGSVVLVLDARFIYVGSGETGMTPVCGGGRSAALPQASVLAVALDFAVDVYYYGQGGQCLVLFAYAEGGGAVGSFDLAQALLLAAAGTAGSPLAQQVGMRLVVSFASSTPTAFVGSLDGNVYVAVGGRMAEVLQVDVLGGCLCEAGLYCAGGQACVQAPAGSYAGAWAASPVPCPLGYVGLAPGSRLQSEGCWPCPQGYTTYAPGAWVCQSACPSAADYFNVQTGACARGCNASQGLYLEQGQCLPCWLGTGATAGVAGPGSCALCPPGKHGASPGVCAACPNGTTTADRGATLCTPIPTTGGSAYRGVPGATSVSATSGGDAVYVGARGGSLSGALSGALWRLAVPPLSRNLNATPAAVMVSASAASFDLVQVSDAEDFVYWAAQGASCVYRLALPAPAAAPAAAPGAWAGDCSRASNYGTGLLGSVQSLALVEEGVPILAVSTAYGGCSAIYTVSTLDAAILPLAHSDALQFAPVFLPECQAAPFILAAQRGTGALYVAVGQQVYRTDLAQPSTLFDAPLLTAAAAVLALAVQPSGLVLLATGSALWTHFAGTPPVVQVNLTQSPRASVATAGGQLWYAVQDSTQGVPFAHGRLTLDATPGVGCPAGFVPLEAGCMQAGVGHLAPPSGIAAASAAASAAVSAAASGTAAAAASGAAAAAGVGGQLEDCPAGTKGTRAGAYSLRGHCQACEGGHVAPGPGSTVCTPCPAGQWASADHTACLPGGCAPGSYTGAGGQCVSCGVGFTTNPAGPAGAGSCVPCPAGTYANASSSACQACPPGFTSLVQSDHCVPICDAQTCARDGRTCASLTDDFEVLTQITMSADAVALAVDVSGGVFYTDGTFIRYYLDDCPGSGQVGGCLMVGADLLPAALSGAGYTLSALAICNTFAPSAASANAASANAACPQVRALFAASLLTNSVYRLDVCSGQDGTVNAQATVARAGWTLLAGMPLAQPGYADGPFAQARFSQPVELALTSDCGLLFVSDFLNHAVRMLNLTSRVASTALGTGLACPQFGPATCPAPAGSAGSAGSAGATTCVNLQCASLQLPGGLGLSADDRDLYVTLNLQNQVGVLTNAANRSAAVFSYVCGYTAHNAGQGTVLTCDLEAEASKSCPLYRPFDVVASQGGDLFVGVTQGLTRISSGACTQVAGQYFGLSSEGLRDGVGPNTTSQAVLTALDMISAVNVPFRVAIAAGTGVLYFADLANGAVRRMLVGGHCTCPAGLAMVVDGAGRPVNSCYDASPAHDAAVVCACGFYALPGDTACTRSCADAAVYGSTAAPCLSLQLCGPSATAPAPVGFTFAQVVATPQPLNSVLADWYGANEQAQPAWDAIFRSSATYSMGLVPGRAPWGLEFLTLTYQPHAGNCWQVESAAALQPALLLPGLWYPCAIVTGQQQCQCPLNVGAFGVDDDGSAAAAKTWYGARWQAANSGGRSLSAGVTAETAAAAGCAGAGAGAGASSLYSLDDLAQNGGSVPATAYIRPWSRFVMVGTSQESCPGQGGPCFAGWQHLQQSPPTTAAGYLYDVEEAICVGAATPAWSQGGEDLACFAGWPAHYACPDGYFWVAPSMPAAVAAETAFCAEAPPQQQVACLSCMPGYFSSLDAGVKGATGGPYACQPCEVGTFSGSSGASACTACPDGSYANASGSTACAACRPGTQTNRAGAWAPEQCAACPAGTGSCAACQPGLYQVDVGQLVCLPAPAGTFTNTTNASAYTPCPPGTYQPLPGRAWCDECPQGQYTPAGAGAGGAGAVQCTPCRGGAGGTPAACDLVVDNQCGVGCGLNMYWQAPLLAGARGRCLACPPGTLNPTDTCALGVEACQGALTPPPLNYRVVSASPAFKVALCPNGQQANASAGFATCVNCSRGTYSNNAVTPGCVPCPAGTFSNRTSGASACTQCPAGAFGPASRPTTVACVACPAGAYSPSGGFTACLLCPAGTQNARQGQTACAACAAGFFANTTGTTGPCPLFCRQQGQYVLPGDTACRLCMGGLVTSDSSCTGCGLGSYMAYFNGNRVCQSCGQGTANLGDPFCSNSSACCRGCPSPTQYAASPSLCVEALPGYMPSTTGSSGAGSSGAGSSGAGGQQACPAGTFRGPAQSACTSCPAGTFAAQEASTNCTPCSPGAYGPQQGLTVCPYCQDGLVSAAPGARACGPCPAGSVSSGGAACVPCLANSYNGGGGGACLPCGPGSVSGAGASACGACPAWTRYLDGSCSPCAAGSYMASASAGACTACGVGKYLPVPGGTSPANCTPCPEGLTASAPGSGVCSACGPGRVWRSVYACGPCAPGTFNAGGGTACAACAAGSYSSAAGQGACTPCDAGSFGAAGGATACSLCAPGTFAGGAGQTLCRACTGQGFAAAAGATACSPRHAVCDKSFFIVPAPAELAAQEDNQCAPCQPCGPDQLAAFQTSKNAATALYDAQQAVAPSVMEQLCPGNTAAPLYYCVPSSMTPGFFMQYSSSAAGLSSGAAGGADPYQLTACPALSQQQDSLAVYVAGPSVVYCYVACRFGVNAAKAQAYVQQTSHLYGGDCASGAACQDAAANLFLTALLLYNVSDVCAACPQTQCEAGRYRPVDSRGPAGCGPSCALAQSPYAALCALYPDGCTRRCSGLPANAFFTTGSRALGDAGGCQWQCEEGYHLDDTAGGCAPCLLPNSSQVAVYCQGTNYAISPVCRPTSLRADLCVRCSAVAFALQPTLNPDTLACEYRCRPGYFLTGQAPTCEPCQDALALVPGCGVGAYLDVGGCAITGQPPVCRACLAADAGLACFTTAGGVNASGCRAICKAGFHTVSLSTGEYYAVGSASGAVGSASGAAGPLAVDLACVRCLPTDNRSCAGDLCYPGYWRVPTVPDGQPGSCAACTVSAQCPTGSFAPQCWGNETTGAVCRACPPPPAHQQPVPYAAQLGPNRNRISTASGDCPTACVNNYVQSPSGACQACADLVGAGACRQVGVEPLPCAFVYSHWNATPGPPWWSPQWTPGWLAIDLASMAVGADQRAGLCWACPFGTGTTAESTDLCVVQPGFSLADSLPPPLQPIPTLPEGLVALFQDPRQPVPVTLAAGQGAAAGRRLVTVDTRRSAGAAPGAQAASSGVALMALAVGPCPYGWFKPDPGDGACQECPPFSSTTGNASVSVGQCLCLYGHYALPNGTCAPCPPDTFLSPSSQAGSPCLACPANETTFGLPGSTACACRSGLIRADGATCTPCPADSYCPPCYQGDAACGVRACFSGARSGPGSVSPENCTCPAGQATLWRTSGLPADYYCAPLPPGATVVGGALVCMPGWTRAGGGGCSLCAPGEYAVQAPLTNSFLMASPQPLLDAQGAPTCVPCPAGTYSASSAAVGAASCQACPLLQTTAGPGSPSAWNCTCPAGMAVAAGAGAGASAGAGCVGCTPSQYYAHDECVDCPDNAVALPGASAAADCACKPGFQGGASGASEPGGAGGACEPCPRGTFSAFSSNAPCASCPAGSTTAGVGATSGLLCGASAAECQAGYGWRQGLGCFRL